MNSHARIQLKLSHNELPEALAFTRINLGLVVLLWDFCFLLPRAAATVGRWAAS